MPSVAVVRAAHLDEFAQTAVIYADETALLPVYPKSVFFL
jgi:hypothetical protein